MEDLIPKYTKGPTEEIRKVCDSFGYGNVMSTASVLWREKLGNNDGGAHSVGPCIASLVPCGCQDRFKNKCDWCAGTHKLTKYVKQIKDRITNKRPEAPKEEYEIQRTMVVSQYHISRMDAEGIEYNGDKLIGDDENHPIRLKVKRLEHGYILFIDPKLTMRDYKGYSPAFKNLIKLAKKNKCQFIQFDSVGTQYDGLEIFTW